MTTTHDDNETNADQKAQLIERIATEVWSKNTRFTPEKIMLERQKLEAASYEAVSKTAQALLKTAKDNEVSEKMKAGSGLSAHEAKQLLSDMVENRFEAQTSGLHRQMFRLIAEGLPVIKLQINEAPAVDVGIQHKQFKKLLAACTIRSISGPLNVWLTGPAGSGKTKGAESVAKAMNIPFEFNGAIDTEYKLTGFVDAGGKIVSTAFRKAYETGGVYLFDEVDASLPGALLAFNAALANGYADFPGGRIDRHKDCIIIAAANTWGTGPNAEYVGRNKLDAAFLDRFTQLAWGYDDNLERMLAQHDSWVDFIQAARQNALAKGVKAVISPRASISGGAMLKSGMFTPEEVIDMTVKKGMNSDNWAIVTQGINIRDIDPTDGGRFKVEYQEAFVGKKAKMK